MTSRDLSKHLEISLADLPRQWGGWRLDLKPTPSLVHPAAPWYHIELARVRAEGAARWIAHMAEKSWCSADEPSGLLVLGGLTKALMGYPEVLAVVKELEHPGTDSIFRLIP